ncbi:hypothetical protein ACP4OV_029006 [Aristida adscensionis]
MASRPPLRTASSASSSTDSPTTAGPPGGVPQSITPLLNNPLPSAVASSSGLAACLREVPALFFKEDFALEDGPTFSAACPLADDSLQERLGQHLDAVEAHLVREIALRSESFYEVQGHLRALDGEIVTAVGRIRGLREAARVLTGDLDCAARRAGGAGAHCRARRAAPGALFSPDASCTQAEQLADLQALAAFKPLIPKHIVDRVADAIMNESVTRMPNTARLIFDTGASFHVVPAGRPALPCPHAGDNMLLRDVQLLSAPKLITAANGSQLRATSMGRIECEHFSIPHVYIVEGISNCVISVSWLVMAHGLQVYFSRHVCKIKLQDGTLVGGGFLKPARGNGFWYDLRFLKVPESKVYAWCRWVSQKMALFGMHS